MRLASSLAEVCVVSEKSALSLSAYLSLSLYPKVSSSSQKALKTYKHL